MGAIARCCAANSICPYKGQISTSLAKSLNCSVNWLMLAAPGKKASNEPVSCCRR
ncbi:Uncharacterised protein [Vibrio cholerae]|nr:Uncharacterised protein [Vibrio cholerae]